MFDFLTSKYYALKVILKNQNMNKEVQKCLKIHSEREIEAYKILNHVNIVKLYGLIQIPEVKSFYNIILEYCDGQDLSVY